MNQERTLRWRDICLLIFCSILIFTTKEVEGQSRIIISQYIETSSGRSPKGIELWNPTSEPVDFSTDTLTVLLGRNGGTFSVDVIVANGQLSGGAVMVIGTSDIGTYLSDQGLSDVMYIENNFTFNGDDALQIQLGGTIEDTFGNPGDDPGLSWDGNGVSTKNSNIELIEGITTGSSGGFTDPSERYKTVSTDNSLTGFGIAPVGTVVAEPKPEPSEAAQFTEPDSTTHSITLNWSDAGGEVTPDGYLVKVSDVNPNSIALPVDGMPEEDDADLSDGYGAVSVSQGTQTAVWRGLEADKTYYFRMFSFTNSGADINYKTDNYASISVTTSQESVPVSGMAIKAAINEFHYDNAGSDSNEFVEVAVDTSVNISNLEILLYNGSNGGIYNTTGLSEFDPGEREGRWKFYAKQYSSIQNGPDGMALVYHFSDRDTVVQFISYEGSFTASEGAANGLVSYRIDVSESSGTGANESLGLAGILSGGTNMAIWKPMTATPGNMNDRESIFMRPDTIMSRTVIRGEAGWRMLSSPVTGLKYSNLQAITPLQGFPGASEGSDKNLFSGYDGNTWNPPSTLAEPIMIGQGFILYFYNNDLEGSRRLPIDFDLKGGLSDGPVTVSLHTNGDGFNLIGNPYPQYIDLSSMDVNGGVLASNVAQVWDGETGSYILSTELGNQIAPFQGFFIQNQDAESVTFHTNSSPGKVLASKVNVNSPDPAIIGFEVSEADSDIVLDKAAALYFSDDAVSGWDKWDMQKLLPLQSEYAILGIKGTRDGNAILKAEESQPLTLKTAHTFELTISGTRASGNRILEWPVWRNIPASWKISLKDRVTQKIIDMRTDSLYRFKVGGTQGKAVASNVEPPAIGGTKVNGTPDARFEVTITPTLTDIENRSLKPGKIKLAPNYPNPFNPETKIKFYLPSPMRVNLAVYDILGRKVTVLMDGNGTSGWHTVTWKAGGAASGVYFYRLETSGQVLINKMLLIR